MMTILLASVAIIGLLIFFNALYVAAEFSTVAARRTRISQAAAQGDRLSVYLLPILVNPRQLDRYVAACQIGITISSLVLGAFAQGAIATRMVDPLSSLIESFAGPEAASTLAQTFSVIIVLSFIITFQTVLGELFPKSVAIQYPEDVSRAVIIPMRVSLLLFALPIRLFNGSATLLLKLLGRDAGKIAVRAYSAEEIGMLVTESHEGGLLDDNERRLLRNALRMRDLTARQVMAHRTKIVAVPINTPAVDLIDLAIEAGHSRILIYRESIDDIAGFVHVKDVFRLHVNGQSDINTVIREPIYVPETLAVTDIWDQLNKRRQYLAVVFDEFGGTAGLLTLEDLIEEIFGELQDEFDDEMAMIARDKEGRIYLRGDLLISDVNEYLELKLPVETTDTLSGLVFSTLGRPPLVGDEARFDEVIIRVETMDDLTVSEVSLQLPGSDVDSPFTEWDIADHD
jgi:putative hemolysin